MSTRMTLRLLRDGLCALQYMHLNGLTHKSLCPRITFGDIDADQEGVFKLAG